MENLEKDIENQKKHGRRLKKSSEILGVKIKIFP